MALLTITKALAAELGGTYDDTEGLINFPLTVKDVQAVAFFKESAPGDWRVSLRSKGAVDTGADCQAVRRRRAHERRRAAAGTGTIEDGHATFARLLAGAVAG